MEGKEQEANIDELKKRKKAVDELKKATKEFNKEQEKEGKQTKANTSSIKNATDALKDFNNNIGDTTDALKVLYLKDMVLAGGILGLGKALIDTAVKILTFNSELHRTVINAGKGAAGVEAYSKTVVNLGKSMGATQEDAQKVVKTLAELQYLGSAKEIESAAEASYGLARAFGISHEEVTQNTVELQKWGQVSAQTTTAMYADLMKVAQANGLTKNGVSAIMKTTTEWSGMLKAFGKTAPMDVQRYNMSLAKTVSALEKVGISAQTSTKLLEDLTDPTQIEANIPAYAALGISITDAISGNIDPEKMGAGLKEFGEKLKQMGPIAGAQYAKAMGVSYKDAIKAASADMAEASQVDMTPEEKSAEAMKQLTEATKSTTEKIQDIFTKIGAKLRSFGPLVMIVGGTLINFLMKRINKAQEENLKNTEENVKKQKKTKLEAIQEEIKFLNEKQKEGYNENRRLTALMAQEEKLTEIKNEKDKRIRNRQIFEELATNSKRTEEEIKEYINNRINEQKLSEKKAQQEIIDQKLIENEKAHKKIVDLEEEFAKAVTDGKKKQIQREIEEQKKAIEKNREEKIKAEHKIKNIEKELASKTRTDNVNKLAKEYDKLGKSVLVKFGKGIGTALDAVSNTPLKIKAAISSTVGAKIGKGLMKAGEVVKDKLSKIKIGKGLMKAGEVVKDKLSKIKLGKELISAGEAVKDKLSKIKLGKGLMKAGEVVKDKLSKIKFGKELISAGEVVKDKLSKIKFGKGLISAGEAVKDKLSKIKLGRGLMEAGEAVKDKLSKIKIGIKQASGSGPGKMLKTLGGIGKTLGVVGIVMSIISKSLTELGDPFESLIDSLVNIFVPIMKALMPPLMSILTVLVKSLLPPLLRILSLLMKVLSVTIVPVLGFLLKALSHIPGLGFLRETADGISKALGPKTQKAIEEAADAASNLSVETKENTEETKKSTENKKEQIQVGKSGRVTVTKAQYKEEETKEETKKETNSSQAVANNTNTNTNVVALKETNKELLDIKLLMGQFMGKISEIIDRNNNSMEMAKAVEIGCKRAYQDGVPVKIEELPSAIGSNRPNSLQGLK